MTAPPLKDLRLALAIPSYDGKRSNALPLMSLARRVGYVAPIDTRTSLLAHCFNICFCEAMKQRDNEGVTHMLMLHDDVIPCTETWFDNMWEAFHANNAQLMSAVVPIKDASGKTSTAIDDGPDKWRPRRLTLTQCHAQPITFTLPNILLNTGCMLLDLQQDWVDRVWFTVNDDIVDTPEGPRPRVEPEDWWFSRQARAAGCERMFATRAVELLHAGQQMWPNYQVYGMATDDGR